MSVSSPDQAAYVEVAGLTVEYRSASGHTVQALQDVSLEMAKGAFVVLAGPSGSGKSTALYVLAGLLHPNSGTVRVGNQQLGTMSPEALARFRCWNVGFIFQSFQLLPHLRAWENVALPLIPAGIPSGERRQRACEMLSRLGLGTRINHRPGELSAGEQQRVAIARATINSPKLVLADEPTGNLDASNSELVANSLKDLAHRLEATVICATHDERLASQAQVLVRLTHGRIAGVETTST